MKYIEIKNSEKEENITKSSVLNTWLSHNGWTAEKLKRVEEVPFPQNEMMLKTSNQLKKALEKGAKIMVSGDYDCDGICGTTILVDGFRHLGFETDYMILDRINDGYGINESMVDRAISQGCQLIVTVDNGITCREALQYALDKGLEVIVTDHHSIPEEDEKNVLCMDVNVIHPFTMRGDSEFREISGATVAYKMVQNLFADFGIENVEAIDFYRALAGITVISDVMPLVDENREIFKFAQEYLRNGINSGLDFFMKSIPNLDLSHLDETSFGFSICPVINAIGRLDNAELGVEYLLLKEDEERKHYVPFFVAINERRKELQSQYISLLEEKINTSDQSIIFFDEDGVIHEGIIGILAGRMCNMYGKPTVIFSKASKDGAPFWKASARSTEQVSIIEALNKISSADASIMKTYGGHAGAAGISIYEGKEDDFRKEFNKAVATSCKELEKFYVAAKKEDIPLLLEEMESLQPFGHGFERPVIKMNFEVECFKAYFKSKKGLITNDVIEFWVDFDEYLDAVRKEGYRLSWSSFDKLLANGDENPMANKTEYYRPKNRKIAFNFIGSISPNYFGGKKQARIDLLKKEM